MRFFALFNAAAHCIRGTSLVKNRFEVESVRLGEHDLLSDIDCEEVHTSLIWLNVEIDYYTFDAFICRVNVLIGQLTFRCRGQLFMRIINQNLSYKTMTSHWSDSVALSNSLIGYDRFVCHLPIICEIKTLILLHLLSPDLEKPKMVRWLLPF